MGRQDQARVVVTGRFRHDREIFLGARSLNGNPGYHLVTPFRLDDGRVLLVDRGWIPLERKTPDKRALGQVAGQIQLDAVIRLNGRQSWLVPDNRPEINFFFWIDLPTMAKLAGKSVEQFLGIPVSADRSRDAKQGLVPGRRLTDVDALFFGRGHI